MSNLESRSPDTPDISEARTPHKTIPMLVWADVDEGIAAMVRCLNNIEGVRTSASCQGTLGEGGPAPYRAQVMITWTDDATFARLAEEFDTSEVGDHWCYVHPREGWQPPRSVDRLPASLPELEQLLSQSTTDTQRLTEENAELRKENERLQSWLNTPTIVGLEDCGYFAEVDYDGLKDHLVGVNKPMRLDWANRLVDGEWYAANIVTIWNEDGDWEETELGDGEVDDYRDVVKLVQREFARLTKEVAAYRSALHDIADNYDHENGAREHNPRGTGTCRVCTAKAALNAAAAASLDSPEGANG